MWGLGQAETGGWGGRAAVQAKGVASALDQEGESALMRESQVHGAGSGAEAGRVKPSL